MKRVFTATVILLLLNSCEFNSYGPQVKTGGVEVYYQPDSLTNYAKSFSVMLDTLGYGDNGDVSFQLVMDSLIHINMVTTEQYHKDTSMDYSLNAISIMTQLGIFKGERVQLHICNDRFKTMRSLDIIKKI